MKSFSLEKLAETVLAQRKALHITQQDLAAQTGINRSLLSRLEKQDYIPAPDQMVRLANALSFDPSVAFIDVMDPVTAPATRLNVTVFCQVPFSLPHCRSERFILNCHHGLSHFHTGEFM